MGLSIHQARSLAHLAEKNGCITQVSFQRRSCPMVVKLREACLERPDRMPSAGSTSVPSILISKRATT